MCGRKVGKVKRWIIFRALGLEVEGVPAQSSIISLKSGS